MKNIVSCNAASKVTMLNMGSLELLPFIFCMPCLLVVRQAVFDFLSQPFSTAQKILPIHLRQKCNFFGWRRPATNQSA